MKLTRSESNFLTASAFTAMFIGFASDYLEPILRPLFLSLFVLVGGCTGLSIEKPTPNCVDYVQANKIDSDIIHFGKYIPVTNYTHVWLERNGQCFDNMNQKGFDCDSELYRSYLPISADNNGVINALLCRRPAVNGHKSCEVNKNV